jgi:hypothetical protein
VCLPRERLPGQHPVWPRIGDPASCIYRVSSGLFKERFCSLPSKWGIAVSFPGYTGFPDARPTGRHPSRRIRIELENRLQPFTLESYAGKSGERRNPWSIAKRYLHPGGSRRLQAPDSAPCARLDVITGRSLPSSVSCSRWPVCVTPSITGITRIALRRLRSRSSALPSCSAPGIASAAAPGKSGIFVSQRVTSPEILCKSCPFAVGSFLHLTKARDIHFLQLFSG